jgi:hypothetical protein
MSANIENIASALGGRVSGMMVYAPAPNKPEGDRSLTVIVDSTDPDGFRVQPAVYTDYVRHRIGTRRAANGSGGSAHDARSTKPKPAPAPRFKLIKFKDARPDFSRRRELVQGLLPTNGIAVVWGPPKCYKSFWIYDLCMHPARGLRYHGRRVHQCPVIYVALEGQAGFPDRLEAYRQHYQMKDDDVPFHLVCTQLGLTKDADQLIADIKMQIGDTNPGVICLDTLNRSLEGSESRDEDMAAYLNAAEKIAMAFDCLVIIVHHCGIDGTRPRGHTSLSGAAVVQISVKRTADKFRAVATVEMAKDMAEGDEVHFKLEPVNIGTNADGDIVSSLVVLPTEPPEHNQNSRKPTKNQQTMYRMVYDADPHGLTVEDWNERARAVGIGVKRRSDLLDNRNALKDMKMVRESGGRWKIDHKSE